MGSALGEGARFRRLFVVIVASTRQGHQGDREDELGSSENGVEGWLTAKEVAGRKWWEGEGRRRVEEEREK